MLTTFANLNGSGKVKVVTMLVPLIISVLFLPRSAICSMKSYLRNFGLECTFSALSSTPGSAMPPWMTKPQSKNEVCIIQFLMTNFIIMAYLLMINHSCSTPEKIHTRVKTWTRRVDLFLKDYIILPVCDR